MAKIKLLDVYEREHVTLTAEHADDNLVIEITVREAPRRLRREHITISLRDFMRLASMVEVTTE
jgi:hypothetical protein